MSALSEIRDSEGRVPKYAWPGGYPMAFLVDDGEVLCADCVNDPSNPVHEGGEADGWRVEGYVVHWEGGPLTCSHCNVEIPSAYGDPDEED